MKVLSPNDPPLLPDRFGMDIDIATSSRTPYGFEKLNDGNYATWAFDVKYQFLKEKLWGLVSGTEDEPIRPVPIVSQSETAETSTSSTATDRAAAEEAEAEYQTTLSKWNDKVNAEYLILVTTIVGRLQAPVRQATSPVDAWNRLRDLYSPSGLQRRFALSRQLYSLHKEPTTSMQQHEITYDAIIEDLARAGKTLEPEDLAITYLNTLPDDYSSLIQSMEPFLSTLTSQGIKSKVREEEQRLRNLDNKFSSKPIPAGQFVKHSDFRTATRRRKLGQRLHSLHETMRLACCLCQSFDSQHGQHDQLEHVPSPYFDVDNRK